MNSILTCQVYNTTIKNIDDLGCRILTFAANLYYYDFGYICMGPLALIFIISVFGRIKENYRWFILNQVFWDLLSTYDYTCENYSMRFLSPLRKMPDEKCLMYNFQNAD